MWVKTLAVMQGLALVSSPPPSCSEASFGKPEPKKKQPSYLRLASQQEKTA